MIMTCSNGIQVYWDFIICQLLIHYFVTLQIIFFSPPTFLESLEAEILFLGS